MKVLITGGSSLLGKALKETCQYDIECTWYTNYIDGYQMNVTNKSQVRYVFDRVKPDIVIHCAANGSVDYAQNNYQEVYHVNVEGTRNIMLAAKDYNAKVVYISSNAVYAGDNPPYSEESETKPLNSYGSIKLQAEQVVVDHLDWLIVRPFLLFGWPYPSGRQNWATLVYNDLSQDKPVQMVNDVVWQPTYVVDCAEAIWKLLEFNNEIFNIASPEKMTLYRFAVNVAEVFELDKGLIEPVASNYFESIAPRPKDTSYDLGKIEKLGIVLNDVKSGLKEMKNAKS